MEDAVTAPASERVPIDPTAAIPSLVKSLADDSKRLLGDEVRLAKLEIRDSVHSASRGVLWLALAFGVGVVMLVALTLTVATAIGDLASGHMWVGALVTGVVEVALAVWLVRKGIGAFATDAYTLPETRETAKDFATWSRAPQQG